MEKSAFPHLELPLPDFEPGTVWLVGAGPGDPGLLTLNAVQGLKLADVVVYDALVDDRILRLASPGAAMIYAGKRGGKPSPKQPDITNALIDYARDGLRVLRLKGGDPFIFGRGAEEALALREAGVVFRVVPGITAGIGGLAYAGIPATSRETNSAITFLTGHGASGDMPDNIDWNAIANGAPVLVMYMAVKHLERICRKLIEGGRPGDEPAAAVRRAATAHQRVVEATLATLPEAVAKADLQAPAVIAVGPVVRLRAALDWAREQVPVAAE